MSHFSYFRFIPFLCCFLMVSVADWGQSVTIVPNSSSTITSTQGTNYFDLNKTGTNNFSGLRFLQNQASRGGLFFSDDQDGFNLSSNSNSPGLVWNRTASRAGIGTFSPVGKLHILTNNTNDNPHLTLQENNNADGARIQFTNFGLTGQWTLYGSNAATPTFNIFHSDFGNIVEFKGDGTTEHNGFTKLGDESPKMKMKKFIGTLPDANQHEVSLGIDLSKILAYEVLVDAPDAPFIFTHKYKPSNDNPSGRNYRASVRNGTGSSSVFFSDIGTNMKGNSFTILVTFEE